MQNPTEYNIENKHFIRECFFQLNFPNYFDNKKENLSVTFCKKFLPLTGFNFRAVKISVLIVRHPNWYFLYEKIKSINKQYQSSN